MTKGIPLLLIGIGIFTFSIFSMHAEAVKPEFFIDDSDFISNNDISLSGLILGGLLMGLGSLKFFLEKQQDSKFDFKKVSLFWQVVGSAIPGFDLFVMYRIQKLRLGSIVYASQIAVWTISLHSGISDAVDTNIALLVGIGYVIIVYIWSKKWNEQFNESLKNENEKSHQRRGKLLLSISGGMFFLVFVLFAAHAVLFMDTWDELNLQEGDEGVSNTIFREVPYLIWIDMALVGFLLLAPIFAIIGGIFWFKERKQEMNIR
jgi:hypothetical protein